MLAGPKVTNVLSSGVSVQLNLLLCDCIHFIYFLLVHLHNSGSPHFQGGSCTNKQDKQAKLIQSKAQYKDFIALIHFLKRLYDAAMRSQSMPEACEQF